MSSAGAAAVETAPAGDDSQRHVGFVVFQGAPVQAVLEYYATTLAKRSIISVPANLQGVIFFRSQTDLTVEEAKWALETALAQVNVAIVPMGEKFLKVVQIGAARQEGLPFISPKERELPPADILATQIIPLQYADVGDVIPALQPYLHQGYGLLMALPKSNSILITETGNNVNLMMEIIKAIDVPSPLRMETKVYVLAHAKAGEVVQRLQSLIQEAQQLGARAAAAGQPAQPQPVRPIIRPPTPGAPTVGGAAPAASGAPAGESLIEGKVIITPDERTNKIFVLSRPSNFAFFDKIIAELDMKVEPDVILKVINLNYDTAEHAASLVNALITGGTVAGIRRPRTTGTTGSAGRSSAAPPPPPAAGGAAGAAVEGGFLQFAEGVRILPDERTNSLLVMATKEDMVRIEQLIKEVDTSVAQVQIEVVIAEVTLNNELDVGVDVFKRLFDTRSVSQTGGNITDGNAPIPLISGLTSNLPSAAALAGGPGGLTYFATFRNLKLDAVIHALASTSRGKVLSTPVIQTMDNQEANIVVGESVPVPVSTVSSLVGGVGTLTTGQLNANIEYKDVAIELKVTPRINPDGYVRMDIEQKVNDLGPYVNVSGTSVPTIEKREAKSSVAVEDQSTIVLGGMIKETKNVTETKTPFFGDIPFLGQIFKGKKSGKLRTELIIFIRPTVLRTDAQAVAEARRRSRLLKGAEELELEKQFKSNLTNAPSSSLTNVAPRSMNQPADGGVSPENERHAAKVKALQEQDAQSN
ncbi:MAG: type II secretion system secretin GspD [Verrucomicrobiia bacterium]